MKKTLILSASDDPHVHCVVTELDKLGQEWVLFDPGDFPAHVQFSAHFSHDEKSATFSLPNGRPIHLEDIASVWYRRPTSIKANTDLPTLERSFIEREARMGLWGLLRTISALWVNHPDAIREASYKPRQLSVAQRLGLEIPPTLVTNDPDQFKSFYEHCHGRIIYKLLGFPLYHDNVDQPVSMYTSLVPPEMLDQAHRVKATAHLFQEYVEKQCDLRIIIIGNQVFAVEIHPLSEETRLDFRRDYGALRYAVHCLPETIEQALLHMNEYYRLNYAAIDMLYTPDGRYVYLETNATGQFGWLDTMIDLPLSQTLAKLLAART